MSINTVSFISTHGRGIGPDLELLMKYLTAHEPQLNLRYFTGNEDTSNFLAREGTRAAKQKFMQQPGSYIAMDHSPQAVSDGQKSIVIGSLYGFWLKDALAKRAGKKSQADRWGEPSYFISTSPLESRLLSEFYGLKEHTRIIECCSPLSWDIADAKRREEVSRQIRFFHPEMKGKKVLAVIKAGRSTDDTKALYEKFPMKELLDRYGDEWFILTNVPELSIAAGGLPSRYRRCFGFYNNIGKREDMLYAADALVTNDAFTAGTFSALRKPILVLPYDKRDLERYAAKEYPGICLKKPHMLLEQFERLTKTDEAAMRFCEEHSWAAEGKNPLEIICEIIAGEN